MVQWGADHRQEVVPMTAPQTPTQTPTQTKPKAKFIDFQTLKQEIRIEEAMPLLGLKPAQFSDQMRSPCPACKSGGDRALVITASKNVFYCFASGQGGDLISLTAHIKGIGMKEAAAFLAEHFQKEQPPKPTPPVVTVLSNSSPKKEKAGLNPLTYLQPEHPAVQALGISPEVAAELGIGYAPKGIMRGRIAIPIYDLNGVLKAYCGQAVGEGMADILYPTPLHRAEHIYNAHLVQVRGSLIVANNPVIALRMTLAGFENVVSFLTERVEHFQLKLLLDLMVEKQCDYVSFS